MALRPLPVRACASMKGQIPGLQAFPAANSRQHHSPGGLRQQVPVLLACARHWDGCHPRGQGWAAEAPA